MSAPTIVSWANGTDEQIASMLDAAAAGEIDLQQDGGWAVGDERVITVGAYTDDRGETVSLGSQIIVITSFDNYNNCGNVLQFDFKTMLKGDWQMVSDGTTYPVSYKASKMKVTTLPKIVTALPMWLQVRLKPFDVLVSAAAGGITIETVSANKLALRSEIEFLGTTDNSAPGEGTQLFFYQTESNREKPIYNLYPPASNLMHWSRSPYKGQVAEFCKLTKNSSGHSFAESYGRIAPFGCLGGLEEIPAIISQPQAVTVIEGNNATFSVSASGGNLAYQWQVSTDNGTSWSDITDAEQDSFTVPATTAAMSGNKYRCVVSNAAGSTTSDAATLTVNPVITLPVITVQPQDQTVTEGQSATFAVTATGLNLAYQWQVSTNNGVSWTNISGAINDSYSIIASGNMNGYQYICVVSNTAGDVRSSVATLTVNSGPSVMPPYVTSHPKSQTVASGRSVTFYVSATGDNLKYQWQTAQSGAWVNISGKTSDSITVNASTADNGRQYLCQVSNAAGTVYSNAATLTVQAQPTPTPPTPPRPVVPGLRIIINGVDITRYVRYQGFKWSRNDVDGPNAGRNIIAEMIRDRVATKIRIDITCVPLTKDEHNMIMNLIMPEFVTVQYDDPVYGFTSKIMYANNNSSEYCIKKRNGREYWYNVSFPLIEK